VSRRGQFETIRSEGALLPADLLQRVAERDKDLGGLRDEDYGLPPNEPLNEAIVRSWNRLVGAWGSFREAREKLPADDPGTSVTRDRWLLVLLQELGYGRVQTATAVEIEGKSYAVSHAWESVPIHLVGCNVPLDRRSRGVAGAATQSPHGTVQELLNRSDERLWGIVSNGLVLRVLRDNSSLTRQAYLEFDLEEMLEGEVYADFVLLWLVCHASRVEGEKPHECWLERWSQEAVKQGTRALDGLRNGVEKAIEALGGGFLQPGRNAELRAALRDGELSPQDYYRELLRLVYRLLFLFVAEDRGLLFDPRASDEAKARYREWYSTRRLRELAGRRRGTKHADLYEQLKLVMRGLGSDDGCQPLGLPALGSFLWSDGAVPHVGAASLPNAALLDAIRALATVRDGKVLRSVDYKNLGAEELGSVYESLLELHPDLNAGAGTFALTTAAGNERKTTGSYYTPSSLISELLDSALDPVLDDAAAKGEEAILDLKVCDPACGSGHFLVAAAHRIAKRLASVRTGDEEPSPEATRHALRDVVSRCLYGVDVNPMAVELCKVSLWMEALDPGRPLSFLDAHVKCGNSLLGTTAQLMARGIPDDAFKPLEGDDKDVARELRKQNKLEREGQLTLEDVISDFAGDLGPKVAALESMDDATPGGLHAKERIFRELLDSEAYERAKLASDAWCTAFVQRKTTGTPRITTGVIRRILGEMGTVPIDLVEEIRTLAAVYAFFHWEVEYPAVFRRPAGAFDVVLGNPPWEHLEMHEKEYFAKHSEVAGAKNATERKRRIDALAKTDPDALASWQAAVRHSKGESQILRSSGRYPFCARGRINSYAVFAELMTVLVSTTGRVGCIVPSGVATDDTTQTFFSHLVETQAIVSLFEFENEGFFLGVGQGHMLRFCLLTVAGSPLGDEYETALLFRAQSISEIGDTNRIFTMRPEDFRLLNPNSRTCPIFLSRRDAELTKAIYRRIPVLVNESLRADGNPWAVAFKQGLFNMASDSDLFRTREELESEGFSLEGSSFRLAAAEYAPLYEAKMVFQFDHRYGDYGMVVGDERVHRLPEVPEELKRDPCYFPLPFYWVPRSTVTEQLTEWDRAWLLSWRDVTDARASARTVIATVIPATGVGHNLPLVFAGVTANEIACFYANLNSYALDYVARQKVGGIHLTFFVLNQLSVLPPATYRGPAPWRAETTLADWLVTRVVELSYTSWDLEPFARDLGFATAPYRWEQDRRRVLRCELDAAFFHLYGLRRDDVDYVMDRFPIVRRRDEQSHGEYRTKRLILEIYDELAEAIATGRPYKTRLDPPPADPRVAHLPRPRLEVP
jgi:hypothetical protein